MTRLAGFSLVIALFAVACSSSGRGVVSITPSPPSDARGVVRGLSGVNPAGVDAASNGVDGVYVAVADDLAAQMAADDPAGLKKATSDILSRDGDRVISGKQWFNAAVARTGIESAFIARVAADPAMSGVRVEGAIGLGSFVGGSLTGGGSSLVGDAGGLVGDAGALVKDGGANCSTTGADGGPIHLGAVNGTYGNNTSVLSQLPSLVCPGPGTCNQTLAQVDAGTLVPDPNSRLGAYAATAGYPSGTTGAAVHNAIGTIFNVYSNYGEENIGRVFNSPEAKSLYGQPVSSCAGLAMATLEYQYWSDVHAENPSSPGGNLGTDFSPTVRNFLQNHVF